MTKKQAKEIIDYIEEALQTTETKALISVGSHGKYPYMVGSYESTMKNVLIKISAYAGVNSVENDKDK